MSQPEGDFEREKWQADLELRRRDLSLRERQQEEAAASAKAELDLKRREQDNRDVEIKLKQAEHEGRGWKNPLVLAIVATAVAATGNAAVGVVNGYFQRDLEDRKRTAELALERSKSESARIVEMIKTGDAEKAAKNLEFLLDSGLLADPALTAKVSQFLKQRAPGAGPVLPVPDSHIAFAQSSDLTAADQTRLQTTLNSFSVYLEKLGFKQSGQPVVINVSKAGPLNAYYVSGTVHIHPSLVDDASVALREYAQHFLSTGTAALTWNGHLAAVGSAVSDYLACTYLDNPRLGEQAAKVFGLQTPFIRNLQNQRSFADLIRVSDASMAYEGAEIWGGVLWEVRAQLGREVADVVIASAWRSTRWPHATESVASTRAFVDALTAAARAKGSQPAAALIKILRARGFAR